MFWIVQNNIYGESGHAELMKALKNKKIPHVEVKVVPFFDLLLPSEFDSHSFSGSIEKNDEVCIDENQPIMVLGGTSLGRIAAEKGWKPGSFLNENFHYEKWKEALGDHLLNKDAIVDSFRNISIPWDTFFIRPCEDTKDFNGTVFSKEEFDRWRNDLLQIEDGCLFADSDVVASPVQDILSEYRFFVVDGKIATYSQYKQGNELYKSADVETSVIDFAQSMIDVWQPSKAFVIDIAETPNGLKVIEINNFNSSGYYAADVSKIVDAIEKMTL